jgi:hypothetical protein
MQAPESAGPPHDLARLIQVLDRHRVEDLLVGGAAARAYGAGRLTEDADCVVGRDRANLDRLAQALRELNARLRVGGMSDDEARLLPVRIDGHMLASTEISTWMTDAGGFDVLAGLVAADGHLLPYGHHHGQGARQSTQGSRGIARTACPTGRASRMKGTPLSKLARPPVRPEPANGAKVDW